MLLLWNGFKHFVILVSATFCSALLCSVRTMDRVSIKFTIIEKFKLEFSWSTDSGLDYVIAANMKMNAITKFFTKYAIFGFAGSLVVFSIVNVWMVFITNGQIIVDELFKPCRFAWVCNRIAWEWCFQFGRLYSTKLIPTNIHFQCTMERGYVIRLDWSNNIHNFCSRFLLLHQFHIFNIFYRTLHVSSLLPFEISRNVPNNWWAERIEAPW